MANKVPTVSKTDARTTEYQDTFNKAAGLQKGDSTSPQKLTNVHNAQPNDWTPGPLASSGGSERHYDEASSRPSIPASQI